MMIEPLNINQASLGSMSSKDKTLAGASKQFEALVFRQFLDKAMKPIFKNCLLGTSNAADTYRSFLVDGLSQAIASTHPLNLEQYLKASNYEK